MKGRASFLVSVFPMLMTVAACASSHPPPAQPAQEAPADERAVTPPPSKSIEVKNLCADGVHVYIGDVPNGTTGDHLVLRGGGTSHFPRRPDGTLVIWIEDERGYGLVKVHVSRRMSRVEIGTSCQTLHAE